MDNKQITKIDKDLLLEIADMHKLPEGSFNIRKNGELILLLNQM